LNRQAESKPFGKTSGEKSIKACFEVDQYGNERYWVTEPDGTTYLRDASKISEANAEVTRGEVEAQTQQGG
jgi:hypothetical protein